jgi:hypothetical protein
MKSSVFWDITQCSPLKVNRRFGVTCLLHLQGKRQARHQHEVTLFATSFMLVSCLSYSSTLKMEVTCYSETSLDFQLTTLRYIPEDRNLYLSKGSDPDPGSHTDIHNLHIKWSFFPPKAGLI